MMAVTALFFAAFIAATLLPAQSEAALAALLVSGSHSPVLLVSVATAGNVLGSLTNWILGRFMLHFVGRRWFPFKEPQIERARQRYARIGWVSLFGSWLPIIGDPLTFIAGVMREPLWRFLLVVTLAKGGRYLVLTWIVLSWP